MTKHHKRIGLRMDIRDWSLGNVDPYAMPNFTVPERADDFRSISLPPVSH
jgi:hypothetical protein